MRQTRLDKYFDIPQTPCARISFLNLPQSVRLQIYSAAGLDNECGRMRSLSYRGPERDHSLILTSISEEELFWESQHSPNLLSLLLVCKTVYRDVIPLVYSSTTFLIRYRDRCSLEPLWRFSRTTLSHMTSLIVLLNITSYQIDDDCYSLEKYFKQRTIHPAERALDCVRRDYKRAIEEWKRAATWLAESIQPNRLTIKLICDIRKSSSETALLVLAPFQSLPTLKSCSIRLSRERDPYLAQLAAETVFQVTGCGTTNRFKSHFPFCYLPKELRLKILHYTDLVAPEEVKWSRDSGFHLAKYPWVKCLGYKGCHCPYWFAAYSTQWTCKCWAPPTALFAVNCAMRREALEVFFSQNNFDIGGTLTSDSRRGIQDEPIPALWFLQNVIPLFALRHLRALNLEFSVVCGDYLNPEESCCHELRSLALLLVANANIPVLVLRLSLTHVKREEDESVSLETQRNRDAIIRSYHTIVGCFKELQGLKDFFVMLKYPTMSSSNAPQTRLAEKTLEQKLEQEIMGDGYDSSSRGKHQRPL